MNPLLTTGLDAHRGHTALSVNLNKVALLRNQRDPRRHVGTAGRRQRHHGAPAA
jgi:hypothetical protein